MDGSGLMTAVGNGSGRVMATSGTASGTATVPMEQRAAEVRVSPDSVTFFAVGDTLRLSVEAVDANGQPLVVPELSWTSSDREAAVVDDEGLVTATAPGAATITATVGDARGTSEISVVNPDRAALVALYEATDGPNWVNSDNWADRRPARRVVRRGHRCIRSGCED